MSEDNPIKSKPKTFINIDDIEAFWQILKKLDFRFFRLCCAGVTLAVLEILALLLFASFVNAALQQPKLGGASANILDYLHLSSLTFNLGQHPCRLFRIWGKGFDSLIVDLLVFDVLDNRQLPIKL